jgi:hypothetical protein
MSSSNLDSVKLASKIATLEKRLETNPDPWFEEPVGWLSKPDFKRKEQALSNYKEDGSSKGRSITLGAMMGKKTYSRRYFCLQGTTLSYYREIDAETPAGAVKLDEVLSVEDSVVPDAPPNSIDLRTKDRIFTLAADNSTEMVNWALAITAAISNKGTTGRQGRAASETGEGEIQWKRFDQCFETKQPLLLNVKGVANRNDLQQVTNHWIVVTGFAKGKNGEIGPAEQAGNIKPMDIVVGCNGIDLTELTFNECMSVIRHADWPKTLHFIRDPNTANKKPTIKEAWAQFGTAGAHRRRYLEVKEGEIFHSKPTPGGAISQDPDGRVDLTVVTGARKLEDRSAADDEKFQLIITLKDTAAEVIIACDSLEQLDEWVEAISEAEPSIEKPTELQVIDIADIEANAAVADNLLVFDEITCAFREQRVVLTDGESPSLRCGSRLLGLGASDSPSPVASMRSLQAPACASLNANFQVVMETETGTVILGMSSSEQLLKWVVALSGILGVCNPPPQLPAGIDEVPVDETWNPVVSYSNSGADRDARVDVNVDNIDCDYCGYMFKRGEAKTMMGSTKFRERFFVLKQGKLHYYKTGAQALGDSPTGTINMGDVHEVRTSKDPASPDLAIDIWTRGGRVFIVVPLNAESQSKWLVVLRNAVDEHAEGDVTTVVPKTLSKRMSLMAVGVPAAAEPENKTRAEEESRRADIKASIKKDGILMKKTDNRVTKVVTMKKRYFCLTTSQIAYYETEADMYAEDSDPLGAISMHQIGEVATSMDPKFLPGCALEVSAQIGEAAKKDDDGTRVYVLEAKDPTEAKEWMEAICVTCGRLKLDMVSENVYKSSSNTESDTRRVDQINRQANIYKGGAALRGRGGGRGGRGRPTVMTLNTPSI